MPFLPCILCGRRLEKRISKRKKPYFHCDSCLVQIFVRGKRGIQLLEQGFRNAEKAQVPFSVHARNLYEVQALIKEVDGVKSEIERIGTSYFFNDEKLRIRNALKTKLDNLLIQLEQMAEPEKQKP